MSNVDLESMALEVLVFEAYCSAGALIDTCFVVKSVRSRFMTIDSDAESCAVVLDTENEPGACGN